MKNIAVILSGCGNQDGAEITEAVSTLVALSELGADYQVFAPSQEFKANNFLTGQPSGETRNILNESARIARGNVKNLNELNPADFDGLAIPGGFGVALHLCDWAKKGAKCDVQPGVQKVIEAFYADQKPILAICIAPALIAKVLGKHSVTLTLGDDKENAAEIEKTGAQHENCKVDDYVTDREHKIITTPAYMYDNAKPFEVFRGVSGAVKEFFEMA